MKISLRIFRMSRKVVMIVGGLLLLGGAAGATALYIGKDTLLGPPQESVNGMDCTSVQVIKIQRKDRYWIRKYIKTEPADGLTRVKTALRVAAAVYEKDKPDLVQVVVLDSRGPETRSEIKGRAVGADVIYVPHPEKLASLENTPVLQVKYTDGMATETGDFFGGKMLMPEEDAAHVIASLSERADCIDPPAPEDAAKAAGEGEGGEKKGEAKAGEGAATEHGGAAAEAKPAEGEGEGEGAAAEGAAPQGEGSGHEAKPAEGEAAPAEGEAAKTEAAPEEKKGWFASVKSMVLGDDEAAKPEAPAAAEGAKAEGGAEHPAPDGEAAPVEGAAAEEAAPAHGAAPAAEGEGDPAAKPAKVLSEAEQAAEDEKIQAAAEADAKKQENWLDSIRQMVPADKNADAAPAAETKAEAETKAPPEAEHQPEPKAENEANPEVKAHSEATAEAPQGGEAQQDPLKAEEKPAAPAEHGAAATPDFAPEPLPGGHG